MQLKAFWLNITSLYWCTILLWENLYLVMEYLNGGDLYSLLKNVGSLDEEITRVFIVEVLTDFGLSKVGLINSMDDFSGPSVSVSTFLGDDDANHSSHQNEQRQKHSVVGTPDYLAPEILLGMGHDCAAADWWSVGIILYELLVGVTPFNSEHPQRILNNIINRDISLPKVPEEISYEAYDLINKLLTENPVQRLGATGSRKVKQHSFFRAINWDTLERQKAMFIPSVDTLGTSYFESRYIWNPEDEHVNGGSDFDDMTSTCSSSSYIHDEWR